MNCEDQRFKKIPRIHNNHVIYDHVFVMYMLEKGGLWSVNDKKLAPSIVEIEYFLNYSLIIMATLIIRRKFLTNLEISKFTNHY